MSMGLKIQKAPVRMHSPIGLGGGMQVTCSHACTMAEYLPLERAPGWGVMGRGEAWAAASVVRTRAMHKMLYSCYVHVMLVLS